MGLRFDPVGGGQFQQAVKQLIEAESQPIRAMEARKAKEDARLKLFNDFKGKFSVLSKTLADMSTFRKFRELKVDLGDGANFMSVTLDKERAEPGQYSIEIDELAARTSVISNGLEDPNDPSLGIGFITMELDSGESVEVYVDDRNSSLTGIANLINRNSTLPIRASVMKDVSEPDAPWKLLISAKKDGAFHQINSPEFYFMDTSTNFYVDDQKDAQNAQVQVDGFPIELESNDISDFLPGVNIHLKEARPDQPFTLTITEDYQKIGAKMKTLIDQINPVLQFIVKQNTIDANSDTSTTFAGDTSLQTIEFRIRNLIHQDFIVGDPNSDSARVVNLGQLGVEFDKTGQLTFKEDKFNKTLESNFDLMSEAISGTNGFVNQLRTLIDNYSRTSDGLLGIKEKGIHDRIRQIDDQIDQKQRIVDKKKEAIIAQFSRLEGTLGNLQRQQQFLSATLPGSGNGNMINQLLGG